MEKKPKVLNEKKKIYMELLDASYHSGEPVNYSFPTVSKREEVCSQKKLNLIGSSVKPQAQLMAVTMYRYRKWEGK